MIQHLQRRDEWIYTNLCRLVDPEAKANPEQAVRPATPVFQRLLTIARIHGVLGIVLEKLRPLAPHYPRVWDMAIRAWQAQVVESLRVRRHTQRLVHDFEQAKIPFATLKGLDFADAVYPQARLRTTFDVDIFVPQRCWEDAIHVLEDGGHVEKQHQATMKYPAGLLGQRTWRFVGTNEMEVDLHWNLVDLPSFRKRATSVEFDLLDWQTASGQSRRIPTPASRLVIACMHAIYHHQFEKLILFCDLLQTARQITSEEQIQAVRAIATRTHTRIGIDICLAVASHFLRVSTLEALRQRLAVPLAGEKPLPEVPETLFRDARSSLFTIRNNLSARCRLHIRQWLRDVA